MPNDGYVYAVTRVHIQETGLLSKQDLEQLVSAGSVEEVFRLLADKGWGSPDLPANDPEALLTEETRKTWDLIAELAGGIEQFDVFRYANDYHNLKAAIKLAFTGNEEKDQSRYFLKEGNVELDRIQKAADEHEFSRLPDEMAVAGREAYEALAHTGNGQACDMVIDRHALAAIYNAGMKSSSELLREYATLTVDAANIKMAVRCALMGKNRDFIEKAVAPTGTLNIKELTDAAVNGPEAVYKVVSATKYAPAVETLEVSLAAFERWCDDQMMELIRPQRQNYFSVEPLAAFILGRENEIRMVRLILSAKINNMSDEVLRERMRDTYV